MKYPIGTQFIPRSSERNKSVYTIVDCLTTQNIAGEIIKQVYLCEHDFMGQKIQTQECETTISRGLAEK